MNLGSKIEGASRAKGRAREAERFLAALESYAYYCTESGGFCAKENIVRGGKRYCAGEPLGFLNTKGYSMLNIHGRRFRVHRLVWLWFYGRWPAEELDHINQDKADNRIENLRYGGYGINNKNAKRYSHNTSSCANVNWDPKWKKWVVRFKVSGHTKLVGAFTTFEKAVVCKHNYLTNNQYGFTENHGRPN